MPQFPQRLRFDLPDTFASDRERLADLFERVLGTVFQPKAHLDDLLFARRKRAQNLSCLVLEIDIDDSFSRRNYRTVFDEVAQMRIFLFTYGRFQGDWFLCDLQDLADLRDWNIHTLGDFF